MQNITDLQNQVAELDKEINKLFKQRIKPSKIDTLRKRKTSILKRIELINNN